LIVVEQRGKKECDENGCEEMKPAQGSHRCEANERERKGQPERLTLKMKRLEERKGQGVIFPKRVYNLGCSHLPPRFQMSQRQGVLEPGRLSGTSWI